MYSDKIVITGIVCFTLIVIGLFFYHSKCQNVIWDRDKIQIQRSVELEAKQIELPKLSGISIV